MVLHENCSPIFYHTPPLMINISQISRLAGLDLSSTIEQEQNVQYVRGSPELDGTYIDFARFREIFPSLENRDIVDIRM